MFAAKARGGSWSLTVERATALKIDFDLLLGILLPLVTRGRREEFYLQRHDVGSWQRGEKILLADRLSVAERPLLVEEAAEEEQPGDQGGGQQCEGAPCAHPARGGRGQGGEGGGEEGQHDLRPDDSATDERKFSKIFSSPSTVLPSLSLRHRISKGTFEFLGFGN